MNHITKATRSGLDSFVYDYEKPLVLVDEVQQVNADGATMTLQCGTRTYQRALMERYGTQVEVAEAGDPAEPIFIRIGPVADPGTVRIQMGPDQGGFDRSSAMLASEFRDGIPGTVEELENRTELRTGELIVRVQHYPFQIVIEDGRRRELWSTLPTSPFQHPPTGMASIDGASMADAWPWFFRRMLPFGYVAEATTGRRQSFLTARLAHDEHFYGFGEVYSDLDKRGDHIEVWHQNATGNTWPESYKSVPFFLSSRGYGLFVHSARPVGFHLGDLSRTRYVVQNQTAYLDLFFMHGPGYGQILQRYTALTGPAEMPPLWSFGIWMSRMSYRSQEQVEEVAGELRNRRIPSDVIHIDTDWFERPWINDLQFSADRFPDPAGMIARLREQGFRLSLWQIPYISVNSAFYTEGAEQGYFATDGQGEPRLLSGFFGDAAIVDYSNPEAATWMTEKLDPLFDIGVSCIKTDFGEGAPTDAHYYGVDGEEMHNLYPLLYNRAFYEKTKNRVGEGIVWGRSGYAGSQRYPVQWGGDPAALWEDLANLWHGGLGMGLTGIPFWSMDIGGFGGTPSSKLYIRWLQTGLFVSHPRAHGPIGREPWLFGEEAEALFRAYAELRYRLLAYIWTEAIRAVEHSAPMHQPLLFHAQDDPTAAHIDDQYLFGRDLLVAPMLDPSDHRAIYLTAGRWRDFWSDEPYDGPHWIHREVPLSELPLFVRQDAVIPEIALAQSTDAADFSRVSLHLYPVDGCDRTVELPGEGRLRVEITPTGSGEYRVQLERMASERDRIVDHGPAEQLAVQLHVHETPTTEGTAAPADRARPLPGTSAGTVHLEMGAAAAVDIVSGTEPG